MRLTVHDLFRTLSFDRYVHMKRACKVNDHKANEEKVIILKEKKIYYRIHLRAPITKQGSIL